MEDSSTKIRSRFQNLLLTGSALLLCIIGWAIGDLSGYLALSSDTHSLASYWWTIVSYMAVHGSVGHLLVNIIFLLLFGALIESRSRRLWIFAMLGGGIAGAVAYMLSCSLLAWEGHLCGMSAAVLGLAGASIVITGKSGWISVALAIVVMSVCIATPPEVAAHISGAVAGAIAGLICKKTVAPSALTTTDLINKLQRSGFASLSMAEKNQLLRLQDKRTPSK